MQPRWSACCARARDLIVPLVATEVTTCWAGGWTRGPASFLDDFDGSLRAGGLSADDLQTISDLERRYADLDAGFADLSIVVVAARHRTDRIVTFDQHFRALRPLDGSAAFVMLP
jgi:hypothetical protein